MISAKFSKHWIGNSNQLYICTMYIHSSGSILSSFHHSYSTGSELSATQVSSVEPP